MKRITQLLFIAVLSIPLSLQAHDAPSIHYQVVETKTVESDLLVATLNIQFSAEDAGAASEQVNETALRVVEMAQETEGVTVSSGEYQTWSRHHGREEERRVEWTVRQTLTMEARNFEQLLSRLAEIQRIGGMVQSLNYTLSPHRKREIENQLKVKAVSRFRERAADYAEAAGNKSDEWELLTLTIDGEENKPITPINRGVVMMERAQSVTAPSGTNTLRATVSGTIVLKGADLEERIQSLTEKVVEQLK